jgi:hypothetical protein
MALPRVALVLVGATLGVGLLLSACAAPTDDPEPTTPPAGDVPSSEPTVDDQAPDDGDDATVSPSLSAAGAFEACRAASADTFSGATTWQSFEE